MPALRIQKEKVQGQPALHNEILSEKLKQDIYNPLHSLWVSFSFAKGLSLSCLAPSVHSALSKMNTQQPPVILQIPNLFLNICSSSQLKCHHYQANIKPHIYLPFLHNLQSNVKKVNVSHFSL